MELIEKIKQLPQQSGVYLFKDQAGEIIYIGKAISLKNRVGSYFSKSQPHSAKVSKMISRITDVKYIITASEMEALLLESRLVKKNHPYFNTQLKDDKSYPYIKISIGQPFPAMTLTRKSRKIHEKKAHYFGPFTDVEITRKAVKKLRQIFKLRNCSQRKFIQGKPCLDYQIGLCSAPCADKTDKNEYLKRIKECCLLLSGRHRQLLRTLNQEMKIASQFMFYEKAASIRDTIRMIEKVISQGKISKSYQRKCKTYLNKIVDDTYLKKALLDLQNVLDLPVTPLHIEAFDISNIHGQIPVGSMVVFQSGLPDKKKYRHFKIKEVKGINDVAMMEEMIYRRFRDRKMQNEYLPDLVLLDGGKGQLNTVSRVLQELNIQINLVSLAKREEELFLPGGKGPILLPKDSQAFFLVQRIRDEAHRFAISYHKKLRSRLIKNSIIDYIPGIGTKRKKQLLSRFKSIDDIRKAELSALMEIPGIGEKTACKIKDILEVRYDFKV